MAFMAQVSRLKVNCQELGNHKQNGCKVMFLDATENDNGYFLFELQFTKSKIVHLCWCITWCPFSSAVSPKAGGGCVEDIFNINVKYGSTPRSQLQIKLGQVELSDEVLQEYEHNSNETHFTIVVPFLAPLVALEVFFKFSALHWWLVFSIVHFTCHEW